MALGFSTALRAAQLNQISSIAGGAALLQFWTGPRPSTGGATTGLTKLAELTCQATFAATTSTAVLTLTTSGGVVGSAAALATGTAAWARITTSGGTHVMDMDVGTSGSDLNMSTTSFVTSATISVTSFTITAGNP